MSTRGLVTYMRIYCTASDGRVVWEADLERARELDEKGKEEKFQGLYKRVEEESSVGSCIFPALNLGAAVP